MEELLHSDMVRLSYSDIKIIIHGSAIVKRLHMV